MPSKKQDYAKVEFLSAVFLLLLAFFFSWNRTFDVYELPTLDLRYKIRPAVPVSEKIAFIEISDDSIKRIGSWPFDRKYHALLIDALRSAGAKKIIFDVFFSEEKPGDAELETSIKSAGNVYMPFVFNIKTNLPYSFPQADRYEGELIPAFKSSVKGSAHINIIPDIDGKFRRVPPFIEYQGQNFPQLGFLAGLDSLGMKIEDIKVRPGREIILNGKIKIPLDEKSNIIVNVPGKWVDYYKHYSYIDVVSSYIDGLTGEKTLVNLSDLKDTVCFIGITATGTPDAHPSSYEALYPGVGMHASLFNSMLYKKFIRRLGNFYNAAILLFFLILVYLASMKAQKRYSLLFISLILSGYIILSFLIFSFLGVWVDLFYPVVTMVLFYLVMTFRKYVSELHKRELLENELEIARKIQESLLPLSIPNIKGVEINVKMATAKQVGGDLYDFTEVSGSKIGIMVGDVSGKGVPAALYMARVMSEFKSGLDPDSPAKTLCVLNNQLSKTSHSNLFVTVAYMSVDMESMKMRYSMGGHLPIIMLRKKEEPKLLNSESGMPLGLMECDFADEVVDIKSGDIFVLYTDGVTEAMDKRGEMYGQDRLIKLLRGIENNSTGNIVQAVHNEISKFEGKGNQHDDITVIAVKAG